MKKAVKILTGWRRWNRKEWILFSIWLIILGVFGIDSLFREVSVKLNSLSEEIALTEEKLARFHGVLSRRGSLDREHKKIIPELQRVRDFEGFFQEIERANKNTGLNILNIKPGISKNEGFYKTYSVRIEAQDEPIAVFRFLNTLTDGHKGVRIEQLKIYSPGKSQPKVSIVIKAVSFRGRVEDK